jgi:FdhD protein
MADHACRDDGTPADLEDFALGFSLTEGVVGSAEEIESVAAVPLEWASTCRSVLRDAANRRFEARRRRLAGPVGCGLCGIESIEEAMRRVADVRGSTLTLSSAAISDAVRLLGEKQPLHEATGAVHAAGFFVPGRGVVAAREDVGRHNALDKLAGALARAGLDGRAGAVAVTSRVSVEMVAEDREHRLGRAHRRVRAHGARVRAAQEAGLTVAALVRGEEFDLFTHPERVREGGRAMSHEETGRLGGDQKLVVMANQIAAFFESQPREEAKRASPSTSTISGSRACGGSSSRSLMRAAQA